MPAKKQKLTPVKTLSLTAAQKKDVKSLVVMNISTLTDLGIDKKAIDELMKAEVIRRHDKMTCGDYNL